MTDRLKQTAAIVAAIILLAAASAIPAEVAAAQGIPGVTQMLGPEARDGAGATLDYFGTSVAIEGDLAVVGVPGEDSGRVSGTGALHIYRHDGATWVLEDVFEPEVRPDLSVPIEIGVRGLAVSEGRIFALSGRSYEMSDYGSPSVSHKPNEIFVLEKIGAEWKAVQKISIDELSLRASITSMEIEGDRMAAGTKKIIDNRMADVIRIYERGPSGWVETTHIEAPGETDFGNSAWDFGGSLALTDNRLAVSYQASPQSEPSVLHYELGETGWELTATVTPTYRVYSIALQGTVMALGVAGAPNGVEIHERNADGTWSHRQSLANTAAPVSLDGDLLLTGTAQGDEGAILFRRSAGQWREERTVAASFDSGAGRSVAIDGDRIVVGDPWFDGAAIDSGGVVFANAAAPATEQMVLPFAEPSTNHAGFGASIVRDQEWLVVGAPGEDAVYVYRMIDRGWTLAEIIHSPDLHDATIRYFGYEVEIRNGLIVVSAAPVSAFASVPGRVYVFEKGDGPARLVAKPEAPGRNISFGQSLALSGNLLFVGDSYAGRAGSPNAAGGVFVFEKLGEKWEYLTQIGSVDSASYRHGFGRDISVEGDIVAVGAYGRGPAGAVYLFQRSGDVWHETTKIVPPDPVGNDGFGFALEMENGVLAVGAPGHGHGDENGAVFLFDLDGTTVSLREEIIEEHDDWRVNFGAALSLSGPRLLVGANRASLMGSAFLYEIRNGESVLLRELRPESPVSRIPGADRLDEQFGSVTVLDGEWSFVGASLYNAAGGVDSGAVFFYDDSPPNRRRAVHRR